MNIAGTLNSMSIDWIQPLFHAPEKTTNIAVAEKHKNQLQKMCDELLLSGGLLATFIPEDTEEGYSTGPMNGRITTLLKILPMPANKTIEDYSQTDILTGNIRWPYGWPFEVVCKPPTSECPMLRTIVEQLHGPRSYGSWVGRCRANGPIELKKDESKAIQTYFEDYYDFEEHNLSRKLVAGCFGADRAPFALNLNDRLRAAKYLEHCIERNIDWLKAKEEITLYLKSKGTSEEYIKEQIFRAQNYMLPWLELDEEHGNTEI